MKRVAVIGAGKWGQALGFAAKAAGHEVCYASRTLRTIEGFVAAEEALKSEYLIMTIPSQAVAAWLGEHFCFDGQKVLVAAKGIEASTGRFLNQIYEPFVPADHLAFLSGPSFATEVIQGLPTALVIASHSTALAEEFSMLFPPFIKTYASDDVVGAEVAGAYKNVLAIAAGLSDRLGLGNNARAALITRGLAEMSRFGIHFGARLQSFMGLAGVGDLVLTASSSLSRNYRVGVGLAEGRPLTQILEELGEVAEGVATAHAITALAAKEGLYTPIAVQVVALLEGADPKESLKELLTRRSTSEF